jgi:hypothetical protein
MLDGTDAAWNLPGGLPPGKWVTPDPAFARDGQASGPTLWLTDDPVPDEARMWAALLREHPRSGLWPLLLVTLRPHGHWAARYEAMGGEEFLRRHARRPWHAGELAPVPAAAVDALDAESVLATWWDQVTGQDGGDPRIMPPEQPFERWPGLASASPSGADPDDFAVALAESPGGLNQLTGRDDGVHIGLVPAADGAAALASCGWLSRRGLVEQDAAIIRSWQDRFGARLCMASTDSLALSVAWPPESPDHCLRVAAEHLAYETPEILHVSGTSVTFAQYAADLSGSHVWWFWWD